MRSNGFPLLAGPLQATFDRGELRWVRLGEQELLRGIYAAVRGPGWVTVPPQLDNLRLRQEEGGFLVTFDARHEDGPLHFAWSGRIEGAADGTIRFTFDGRAETSFLKNRVGLCVLHPTASCAGRECEVEHGQGGVERTSFPRDVSPHQPFLDVRAIRTSAKDGRLFEARFDGEWFETEDQRNWSDTSFKTYSTPLTQPFPARLEAGARIRHEVTLRLRDPAGNALPKVLATEPDVPTPAVRLRLGLDFPSLEAGPSAEERGRLRALAVDHLRVSLEPEGGWREALLRAAEAASGCGARLRVAGFLGGPAELERLAEALLGLPVEVVFLFGAESRRSDEDLLARARPVVASAAPGARLGGGTDGWFADLNRHRESARGADVVAFASCPQLHARDDATILENVASLPDVARTARGLAGPAELALGPVSFGPRGEHTDARLAGELGGEWMRGLLASAEAAGFASLTLAGGWGEGGFAQRETPAYRALLEWSGRPRSA